MPHDAKAKAHARDAYAVGGAAYAADTTGIPLRTIQRWAEQNGWVHEPTPERVTGVAGVTYGVAPALNGHKKGATPTPSSPRRLGRRFLQESDAAREARERHRPRDAQAYMTGAAIAQDKARQAGVADDQEAHMQLTPEQMEVRLWAYLEKHKQVMDAAAGREQDGWEAHLRHPDRGYVERVRYQRRLDELLKANGYNYGEAMRQLRAEGWM